MHDARSAAGRRPSLDRVIRIGSMDEVDPDADFWLDKSDQERLRALQLCREACYGRAAVVGRLARVLEVADGA
jgi:hypothetical protein